jgi:hypothetical protein
VRFSGITIMVMGLWVDRWIGGFVDLLILRAREECEVPDGTERTAVVYLLPTFNA